MKKVISVVGATAIGKTNLAIQLANHYKTEIISADSRQFFKEMNIGTAVPSTQELAQAKHHFIQHKSIFEAYSVGDFQREATECLHELFQKNEVVILVGGSGLYIDALLNGLDNFPEVPAEIRQELIEKHQQKGISFLQEKLKELDFQQYNKMDIQNPQRLIRALEVCLASGKPYSSFLNKKEKNPFFTSVEIGLTASRSVIYERINLRVEKMLEQGLLKEAQKLYPHRNLNALQTVGYKELFSFFGGEFSLEVAIEKIKTNTRRFAKRQATWFGKNPKIHWFDYCEKFQKIISEIEKK